MVLFYVQIMSNDFVMQFSPSGVIHKAASHPSSIPRLKGRQQARKTLQHGQRAFTEYVRHSVLRILSYA